MGAVEDDAWRAVQDLLIATGNPGKVREFTELLDGLPFKLVSLSNAGITDTVEETGVTFEENAILKARHYAACSGILTLADDSGLVVDALDGRPGVLSARYGGEELSDSQRVQPTASRACECPLGESNCSVPMRHRPGMAFGPY